MRIFKIPQGKQIVILSSPKNNVAMQLTLACRADMVDGWAAIWQETLGSAELGEGMVTIRVGRKKEKPLSGCFGAFGDNCVVGNLKQ